MIRNARLKYGMKLVRKRAWLDRHNSEYTTIAEISFFDISDRTLCSRNSNTSGRISFLSQVIRPRFKSHLFNKQLLFGLPQPDTAVGSDRQRVAKDHVPGQRKVCIRMSDEHHILVHHTIHIL